MISVSIQSIFAYEILDSRGYPTLEVLTILENGARGVAAVPSGASTGAHEALELRDGNPILENKSQDFDKNRYMGKGVRAAIRNINEHIAPALRGGGVMPQETIDALLLELDGTANKSRLGANAILGVSLSIAKAAANFMQMPFYQYLGGTNVCELPVPLMNILNGGAHSDAPIDIQEFMIVPKKAESFSEALRMGAEIYHTLKNILKSKKLGVGVGDEGGFAPHLASNEMALEVIAEAVDKAGYELGHEVFLALDVAASEFYDEGTERYIFKKSTGEQFKAIELVDFYKQLQKKYPIISIEDGCDENDWVGWKHLTDTLGHSTQLVGDDLFVTNPIFLKRGIDLKVANALLVKPNQIGTLSETQSAIRLAERHGYRTIMSHRSGETEDCTIADLAVGLGVKQIKTGAPCRSDRNAKYNQLLRIEQQLGGRAIYSGLI